MASQPLLEPLSDRELEVLALIAAVLTNREIATRLLIAVGTVRRQTHNIYGKLRVHHRTYRTRDEARTDLFYYIEVFYNQHRLHSAFGYLSPETCEQLYHQGSHLA